MFDMQHLPQSFPDCAPVGVNKIVEVVTNAFVKVVALGVRLTFVVAVVEASDSVVVDEFLGASVGVGDTDESQNTKEDVD